MTSNSQRQSIGIVLFDGDEEVRAWVRSVHERARLTTSVAQGRWFWPTLACSKAAGRPLTGATSMSSWGSRAPSRRGRKPASPTRATYHRGGSLGRDRHGPLPDRSDAFRGTGPRDQAGHPVRAGASRVVTDLLDDQARAARTCGLHDVPDSRRGP